mgnify:FL=1
MIAAAWWAVCVVGLTIAMGVPECASGGAACEKWPQPGAEGSRGGYPLQSAAEEGGAAKFRHVRSLSLSPTREAAAAASALGLSTTICRLGNANFSAHLATQATALVFFYLPQCVVCQRLLPLFLDAARELRETEYNFVPICMIDASTPTAATGNNKRGVEIMEDESIDDGSSGKQSPHFGALPGHTVAAELALSSFPALKIFHYGRLSTRDTVPATSKSAIVRFMKQKLRPASVELRSRDEVQAALDECIVNHEPVALGCMPDPRHDWTTANVDDEVSSEFVSRKLAPTHFVQLGEAFRGSVLFYHMSDPSLCQAVSEESEQPSADLGSVDVKPALLRTPLRPYAFRIFKNHPLIGARFEGGVQPANDDDEPATDNNDERPAGSGARQPPTSKAVESKWKPLGSASFTADVAPDGRKRPATSTKSTIHESTSINVARGVQVSRRTHVAPVHTTPAAAANDDETLSLVNWYDQNEVDSTSWFRPRVAARSDASVAPGRHLTTAALLNWDQDLGYAAFSPPTMIGLIAGHAIPPVDVITHANRDFHNDRSPLLVFVFHPAIEKRFAEELRHRAAVPFTTIAGERSFVLQYVPDLKYMVNRFLKVVLPAVDFNASILFADITENHQIFGHFGFNESVYRDMRGSSALIGVIYGQHKYVYPWPLFDATRVAAFLTSVVAAKATPYVRSQPPPTTPTDAGSGLVTLAVRSTFHAVVLLERRYTDRLVLFGLGDFLSRSAVQSMSALAELEKGNDNVSFFVMDADENDVPDEFPIENLPMMIVLPATSVAEEQRLRPLAATAGGAGKVQPHPVYFEKKGSDFTLTSVAEFLRRHSRHAASLRHGPAEIAAKKKQLEAAEQTPDQPRDEPADGEGDPATGRTTVTMRKAGRDAKGNVVYLPPDSHYKR